MDGPVALITGASAGFGLLAAIELARRGVRVIPTMRDPVRSGALAAAAEGARVHLEPVVTLDVTDAASIAEAATQVRGRYGR
ncbi:MAG: SDR family NAD(P)-dependent oxidoreductase, partial [Myxococcales bacterium]|nr:SDR family NAD(P)-dependent oxidoreductase [Myxococcales bacterium]